MLQYSLCCVYNDREDKCDVWYNMVARFLEHNNLFWQRRHLHCQMMEENYGLWWATVLFLSTLRHRKSYMSIFSAIFAGPRFIEIKEFCYHMAKWHQHSPLYIKQNITDANLWGMPFLQYPPLPLSTQTTPTTHNSTQSPIIPLHQWCACVHDHMYPHYWGTAVRMQCLVGTCCWARCSLYL